MDPPQAEKSTIINCWAIGNTGRKEQQMANKVHNTGGDNEMIIEFVSFCRVLLRLLKSGQIQEAIEELETIIKHND